MKAARVHLAFATCLLAVACSPVAPSPSTPAQSVPSTDAVPSRAPTPPPTVAPEPTRAVGAIVDGVPTSIDGLPVLRGRALREGIEASADDRPLLAGGWFRAGPVNGRFCTLIMLPRQYESCPFGFDLWDFRTGDGMTRLPKGSPEVVTDDLVSAADRPVVVRLHTHDADCRLYVDGAASLEGCHDRAVIDAIEWLGEEPPGPAIPTAAPTPPTDGMTRREAIDRAREVVTRQGGFRLPLACTELVLHSESLGGLNGENNPWLWIVVFESELHDNEVVMHYATGRVLMYASGTGGDEACAGFAGGIG